MTEERIALIENRLDHLEQMVTGVDARLRRIENPGARVSAGSPPAAPVVAPVAPPTPPPVIVQPTPVSPPAAPVYTAPPVPPVQPAAQVQVAPKPDAEYRIGAQVLPRIGAVMLLLGVGYLISLGLTTGWITPAMLFGGAVTLCLGFIGVGQWKREEKEEFGQILTGIGSCGLYLTFAGGHVFQKLYSGETLVGLFMLLSFVNLGYSALRASRSFLAIGLIGGLAAALMPIAKHNFELNLGLHFAILIPCVLIAARHKWMDIAGGLWCASSAALLPAVLVSHLDWRLQVAAIGISTLLCVAAYSVAYKPTTFDPMNLAPILAIGVTAWGAFALRSGLAGSVHLLIFAGLSALLGMAFEGERRRSLLAAGLGIATMLAPFGPERWISCLIFSGCACGYAFVGGTRKSSGWSGAGVAVFALSLISYTLSFFPHATTLGIEIAMLLSMIATACALAWSGTKAGGPTDGLMTLAAVVCLPFLVRTVQSILVTPAFGLHLDFSIAIGFGIATAIVIVLAFASAWESGSGVAAAFGVFALGAYGLVMVNHSAYLGHELTFLVFTIAMAAAIGALEMRNRQVDAPIAGASAIIGLLIARMCQLVFKDFTGTPWEISVTLALCGYTLVNSAVARWRSWPTVHLVSAFAWLGAAGAYLHRLTDSGFAMGTEIGLLFALLGSLIGMAMLADHKEDGTTVAISVIVGVALARMGSLVLGRYAGLPDEASVSLTLGLFAVANSALARKKGWNAVHVVSGFAWLGGALLYLRRLGELGFNANTEGTVLSVLGASLVLFVALVNRNTKEPEALPCVAAIVGWGIFSRLAFLLLASPLVGMQTNPAVSLSWIVYASLLIGLGFWLNIRLVRYCGLTVIGATVGKVLLVDLAGTSPGIRVGVLMALGLAMLGGGYWYIRKRQALNP